MKRAIWGDVLNGLLKQFPFRGVDVCLTSGTRYRISHPESAKYFSQAATLVFIDAEEHFHMIDADEIEEITRSRRRNSGGNSRRKGNSNS